jgi:hypothetical protein
MPTYCAYLGHQPSLSLAELCAMLPDLKVKQQWHRQLITFETAETLDGRWLSTVGGTVLIARELLECPLSIRREEELPRALGELVPPHLLQELQASREVHRRSPRKATFSLRCFNLPHRAIHTLYRSCKVYLKSRGIPSRYIGSERHPAQPGTLLLRGIPGPGSCELVLLCTQDLRSGFEEPEKERPKTSTRLWIGVTCAVQDITAYTQRDVGKPFRDLRTGLLPPKLAQILLNLGLLLIRPGEIRPVRRVVPRSSARHTKPWPSGKDKVGSLGEGGGTKFSWERVTVWDPFCGSGVIALEALHRRAHVLASDRSERMLQGCRENIRWLREREKIPKAVLHSVFKHNALKPAVLARKPTIVVTETTLGPPLTKPLNQREIVKLLREAEELEESFFENLKRSLGGVPVVCTFPVYVSKDRSLHFLPRLLHRIQELGYRLVSLHHPLIEYTSRHTLLYLRPDQFVGREIVCLLSGKEMQSKKREKKKEHIKEERRKKSKRKKKKLAKRGNA